MNLLVARSGEGEGMDKRENKKKVEKRARV